MKSTVLLIACVMVFIAGAREEDCYFHYSNSSSTLEKYENSDIPLHLSFKLSEDISDYDGIRIKFFGSKKNNTKSERSYKTHDLSVAYLQNKKTEEGFYELVALRNNGTNIWFSEIGLERLRFVEFKRIRIEVHLLKEKGIINMGNTAESTKVAYFEQQTNSSNWLSVKEVKRITKPKMRKAVFPIVAFSLIGGISLVALVSR